MEITFNDVTTKKENFPIEWLTTEQIYFHTAVVPCIKIGDLKQYSFQNYSDRLVYTAMQIVPLLDENESFEILKDIPLETGFSNVKELHKIHARMCLVYTHMKRTGIMYNPLIVFNKGGNKHVCIGWQRLSALKMLGHIGKVPFRTGNSSDYNINPATKVHPYISISNLYKKEQEWKV